MSVELILRWEGLGFVLPLAAMLAFRMLTGQISLRGLLRRKDDQSKVSPERIQLLLVTLALSGSYLGDALRSSGNSLPDVSPQMLYAFGASSTLYASVKAWTTLRSG